MTQVKAAIPLPRQPSGGGDSELSTLVGTKWEAQDDGYTLIIEFIDSNTAVWIEVDSYGDSWNSELTYTYSSPNLVFTSMNGEPMYEQVTVYESGFELWDFFFTGGPFKTH